MAEDTSNDAPPEPKVEPCVDAALSSIGSSPEPDQDPSAQEPPPPQKRKGGRKPIYATSEERKQRNRQAQAAFRERRTEYIKHLEATIKHNEDTLQTLQHNHRNATDECLMLRYKNSLLERILLEKGIDVQAELQSKASSPISRPTNAPPLAHAPQGQRSSVNRPISDRRGAHGAPMVDTGNIPAHVRSETISSTRSTQSQATSPTQFSSSSLNFTRSPAMPSQPDMMSPRSAPLPPQYQRQMFAGNQQGDPQAFYPSNPVGTSELFGFQHPNRSTDVSPSNSGPGRPFYPPGYQDPTDPTDPATGPESQMIDEHSPFDRYGTSRAFPPNYVHHVPSPSQPYPFPQDSHHRSVHSIPPTPTTSSSMNIFSVAGSTMEPTDPFGFAPSLNFQPPFTTEPDSSR